MDTTVSKNAQVVCTIDDPATHGEQVKATARELIDEGFRVMLIEAPQSLGTPQQHRLAKVGAEKKPGEPITWRSNTGTDDLELIRRGVELRGGYVNLAAVPTRLSAIGDIDGGVERETLLEALGLDESALYETTPGSQQYVNEKGKLCEAHDRGAHILIRFDESDEELLEAKDALGTSWSWDSGTGVKVLFRSQEGGYALTYPTVRANGQFDDGQYIRTGRVIGCPPALRAYIMEVGGAALERKRAAEQKKSEAQNTSVLVEEMDPDTTSRGFGRVGRGYGDNNAAFVAAWEMEHTVADVLADERIPEDWRFTDAGTDSSGTQQWTAPGVHASDRSAVTGYSDSTGNELLNIFSPSVPGEVADAFYRATEGKKPYDAGQSYGAWQLTCALIYRGDWQAALVGEGMEIPRFPEEEYYGAILHADTTAAEHSQQLQRLRRNYLQAAGFEWAADYPAPVCYIDAVTVDGETTVYVETTEAGSTKHEELAEVAAGEMTMYAAQLPQLFGSPQGTGQAATSAAAVTPATFTQREAQQQLVPDYGDEQLELPSFPPSATRRDRRKSKGEPTALDEVPQTFAKWPEEQAKLEAVWARHCERVGDLVAELEQAWGCKLPDKSVLELRINLWPDRRRRAGKAPYWSEVPGAERKAKYGHDGFPVDPATYVELMNASPLHQAVFWNVRENHPNASITGALLREYQEVSHRVAVGFECSVRGNTQPPNIFVALVSQSGGGKSVTQNARTFRFAEEHLSEVAEASAREAAKRQEAQQRLQEQTAALEKLREKLEADGELTKAETKKKTKLGEEVKELQAKAQVPGENHKAINLSLGEGQNVGTAAGMRDFLCERVENEFGREVLRVKDRERRYFYWDEAVSMTKALGAGDNQGTGSGVDTTLSSIWNGRPSFPSTSGKGEVIPVPDDFRGVRVAVTLALQTKKAQGLLETAGQGFLQRFLRVPARQVYEAAITPSIVARPADLHPLVTIADTAHDGRVTWCEEMVEADRENQRMAGIDDDGKDEANKHWFGHVMRMATVHAVMNGRTHITATDYDVADCWQEISESTLDWVIHELSEEKVKEETKRQGVILKARRAAEQSEAQSTEMIRVAITTFLGEAPHAWHTRSEICEAVREHHRKVSPLLDAACREGTVVQETRGGYGDRARETLRYRLATRPDDQ